MSKNLFSTAAFTLIALILNSCNLSNKEVVFTENELPISVSFAGNTYVTEPLGSEFIDNYTGKFKIDWTDKDMKMSTYFRVGAAGELNIGFEGSVFFSPFPIMHHPHQITSIISNI